MALFFPASGFMGLSGRKDRAKPYRFGRSATNEGTEAVEGFSGWLFRAGFFIYMSEANIYKQSSKQRAKRGGS